MTITKTKLKSLVADFNEALENKSTHEIINWTVENLQDSFCLASSMEDTVLIHLVSNIYSNAPVVFLDTGYHFPETLGTRDAAESVYSIKLLNITPKQTVEEQDTSHGKDLYKRNPDLCCNLRKVKPFEEALKPYSAFITGIKRSDSEARKDIPILYWDEAKEKIRIAPLAKWTDEDIENYIKENNLIDNPLKQDGYGSIGCRPCTQKILTPDDKRSGRWTGFSKTECGIN
jgi:phosphoadenosine phosphosulfate reductase